MKVRASGSVAPSHSDSKKTCKHQMKCLSLSVDVLDVRTKAQGIHGGKQ